MILSITEAEKPIRVKFKPAVKMKKEKNLIRSQ